MPALAAKRLTMDLIGAIPPGRTVMDAGVAGLAVRCLPSGRKSYIVLYRMPGRPQSTHTLQAITDIESGRKQAKIVLGLIASGIDPNAERRKAREPKATVVTLQDAIDHYTLVWPKLNPRAPAYISGMRRVLMRIPEKDRRRPLVLIETDDVKRFRMAERRRGEAAWETKAAKIVKAGFAEPERKQPGVADANRVLVGLGKVFTIAIDEKKWATVDPTAGIKPFAHDPRERTYSADEVRRILAACDTYEQTPDAVPDAANAVRLLLYTGARLQEVVRARWSMFDLDAARWTKPSGHVKQQKQHRLDLDPDGPAMAILRTMRKRRPNGVYLFPGCERTRRLRAEAAGRAFFPGERPRTDLKRPWAQIAKRADLRAGDTRHDIRRTVITWMFDDTSDIKTVGAAAGHHSVQTTLRYQQLAANAQRKALGATTARMAALAA